MPSPERWFLFAGEASGDLYGAFLIQAIRKKGLGDEIYAVAGPKMREEGVISLFPQEQLSTFGFWEIPKKLLFYHRLRATIVSFIKDNGIDRVVLIDFSNFNLSLAEQLRKENYRGKITKVVAPQVWAWGKYRAKRVDRLFDELICFYPFEPPYFSPAIAAFHGHPLIEIIDEARRSKPYPTTQDRIIALFPGSRPKEIDRHLPLMLRIAKEIHFLKKDTRFLLVLHEASEREAFIHSQAKDLSIPLTIVSSADRLDVMQKASFALAKSGTVTLELALLAIPTVVIYQVPFVDYLIARYLLRVRLPYLCIVNILLKRSHYPEFFGHTLPFKAIQEALLNQLNDPKSHTVAEEGRKELNLLLRGNSSPWEKIAKDVSR